MPSTIAQKFKIKGGDTLFTLNAPANFKQQMGPLPEGAKISTTANAATQVHWFVLDKKQMEKELKKVLGLIKGSTICWIYYPKGSSKIQTDLTRDKGWDALLTHNDTLTWISLISFDDTWSAFGFRPKTKADERKDAKPKERPILEYIDAATKTVRLPDDFSKALKKNKKAFEFFNQLAYSHRKEYVEWIVTAKQEATRNKRIEGALEKLGKGVKF